MYDYYAKWEADGTTQRIHDLLREWFRTAWLGIDVERVHRHAGKASTSSPGGGLWNGPSAG
ncbi:hypothetical protein [Micromonospora sp. C31]|uniref:hypothetical protein n=1 Tax=Micromonospora sp. C31 TaxID=2824876 RepID=UPI001FFDC0C3|nr:hypothetical protein [Micromonospora sp. C31]